METERGSSISLSLENSLLKERQKEYETQDEEEDVSIYRITLRKIENTGN
jgi:hypothetical protein